MFLKACPIFGVLIAMAATSAPPAPRRVLLAPLASRPAPPAASFDVGILVTAPEGIDPRIVFPAPEGIDDPIIAPVLPPGAR